MHFIGAENLLESPCNHFILGCMIDKKKKICATCVPALSQWEKLPKYAEIEGKICLKRIDLFKLF